jgi:predicted Zn-dependent protease
MMPRRLLIGALAVLAALLPTACATPDSSGGAQTGAAPANRDILRGVLGGYSVGGVNLGAAAGVATSAAEATRDIPEAEEIQMGRGVAAGLLGAAPLTRNAQQQKYVNNVGRWLAANSGRPDLPWRFGIIDAPTVNAFATPGGHVFVTRGLVERTRSEAELAGVLAHEIAHVVQRHHLNDIRKQAGKNLAIELASLKSGGLAGEAGRAVARVGLEGLVRGLSRDEELEADRIGVVIAARAGYEPYGLAAVLQTLAAMPQDDSAMALFLKTHPSPQDRLAALESTLPASFDALARPNPALARFDATFANATPAAAAPTPAAATPPSTAPAPKPKPKPVPPKPPASKPAS